MKLPIPILLLFAMVATLVVPSCSLTDENKAKAVAMVKQIGAEVAKEAGIAAANTAVALADSQLVLANARLEQAKAELAARQASTATPDQDLIKEQLKVAASQIAVDQARKLLDQAKVQLAKLRPVDDLPPVSTTSVPEPLP